MRTLLWDVELTPLEVYSWSLWPNSIPITMLKESQHMLCFGARWLGEKKVTIKTVHHDGKEDMLETLHAMMDEADALCGWNSQAFDVKHANREFIEAGMLPPSPARNIDLMRVVKHNFKAPSNKLDYWAQNLGLGKKAETGGFQLWLDCMAGDEAAWKRMVKYQRQDVDLLSDLYDRLLPWIPNVNKAVIDGIPDGCVNCGSNELQRRGNAVTTTSTYPRYQCQKCGKWMRGKSLISTTELRPA